LVAGIWGRAQTRQQRPPDYEQVVTKLQGWVAIAVWTGALIFSGGLGCAQTRSTRALSLPAPAYIGDVAVINFSSKFVLIDTSSGISPAVRDMELTVRNLEGIETARLKVTPEGKRPFIAADIVSGTPSRGERVYR